MQGPVSGADRKRGSPLSGKAKLSWRNLRTKLNQFSPRRLSAPDIAVTDCDDSYGRVISGDITTDEAGQTRIDSDLDTRPSGRETALKRLDDDRHNLPSAGVSTLTPPLDGGGITKGPDDQTSSTTPSLQLSFLDRNSKNLPSKEAHLPSPAASMGSDDENDGGPRTSEDAMGNDSELYQLGEPFREDWRSQFSFSRNPSSRYYKPDTSGHSADHFSIYSGSPSLMDSMEYDFDTIEDTSHFEEADYIDELISEANRLPSDELLETMEDQRISSGSSSSMHRQLSIVSRGESVVTFFGETQPKRTRSTISTTSSVFPIKE